LNVEPDKKNVFFLKKGESLSNNEKVYLEIEDRRTGKIYPGYIILDYLKTIKNEQYYGIIVDTQKKHELKVFSSFTNLKSPVSIKDFNTTILNRGSRFEPMSISRISPIIGKVLFSKLKNYFAIKQLKTAVSVSEESDKEKPFVTEARIPQKQVIQEQAVTPELLRKIEEKTINIPADKEKTEKKLIVVNQDIENLFKKNIENNKPNIDELSHIKKRIKIKKIIIKLLALQLVVWLVFIGYKLFKNWKA
ncbi:hypothetical protein J7L67_05315, partial [bacterium]|nr:hypothetical protein [bacterium]